MFYECISLLNTPKEIKVRKKLVYTGRGRRPKYYPA